MTHEGLIAFAPETSAERLNDERRNGRTLYDTSQIRMLPTKPTPLLIDHDEGRPLGKVTQLLRLRDLDGWWLTAVAELEEVPSWLRRGTPASFAFHPLQMSSFGDNVVRSALVTEVSVLSALDPYEPLAKVLYVKPIRAKPAAREEVSYGNGQLIRRVFRPPTITVR